jgi:hypothetical protein
MQAYVRLMVVKHRTRWSYETLIAGGAGRRFCSIASSRRDVHRTGRGVAEQIRKRLRGEQITDRLVSILDPDARPIRKGKLGKPTEFGFVTQICEMTENTKTGARGLDCIRPEEALMRPPRGVRACAGAAEGQRLRRQRPSRRSARAFASRGPRSGARRKSHYELKPSSSTMALVHRGLEESEGHGGL